MGFKVQSKLSYEFSNPWANAIKYHGIFSIGISTANLDRI